MLVLDGMKKMTSIVQLVQFRRDTMGNLLPGIFFLGSGFGSAEKKSDPDPDPDPAPGPTLIPNEKKKLCILMKKIFLL